MIDAPRSAYRVPRRRLAEHVGDVERAVRAAVEKLREPDADIPGVAADLVIVLGRLSAIARLTVAPGDDD